MFNKGQITADAGDRRSVESATTPTGGGSFFNGRPFRWSLGGLLILLGLVIVVPRAITYRADEAIVNGRTAMLLAPIEGVVSGPGLTPGARVQQGEPLATLRNPRVDRSFLFELQTERDSLIARVGSLTAQEDGLLAMRDDLSGRIRSYEGAAVGALEKEMVARAAQLEAVRAGLREREAELRRQEALGATGNTTQRALDQVRADRDRLRFEAEQVAAEIDLLREFRRQAGEGIFVASGRFGAPYMEQRRDEIAMRLLDLAASRAEQETRIARIERQIAQEEERLAGATEVTLSSPFTGVVWKTLAAANADLVIGEEVVHVLDCRSTFLDIIVSESRFEKVSIGERIEYRLAGSQSFRTGTVVAKRGSSAVGEDRSLAARLDAPRDSTFRIWAELDPQDRNAVGADFCNVGRRADVRFEARMDLFGPFVAAWNAL